MLEDQERAFAAEKKVSKKVAKKASKKTTTSPIEERVLQVLASGETTIKAIKKKLGCSYGSTSKALKKMKRAGKVQRKETRVMKRGKGARGRPYGVWSIK